MTTAAISAHERGRSALTCGPRAFAELSHHPEERAQLIDKQLGLLECGEVAAAIRLVPVADVREAPLGPSPRRALELMRKDGAAGWNRHTVARAGRDPFVDLPDALPVQPCGGRTGSG